MRAVEFVTEIENMKQSHFRGGKDTLDRYSTPGKKHLRALPGGSDLMYSITSDAYGSYVHIVDPGIPGITKPSIVASLSLTKGVIPDSVQVGAITVDEDYRGRGLARALYGIVLTIMKKTLLSGSSQTPGGRGNWLSLASIPGVEIKGLLDLANFQLEKSRQLDNTIDQLMQLGGQFVARDNNYTYWAFDVVPGNGQLAPAVKNKLSKLYGYDSDNLLMATWTGGQQSVAEGLEQNVPPVLYHATYKPRLKSIKLKGLGAGGKRNWEDSKRGVIYLALDPNVAESYAESSDMVPDEWLDQIVILKISTAGLDPNKFSIDSNVQDNAGDTVEYQGVIPVSNISLYKQGVAEGKQPGKSVTDAILKVMPIAQEIWFHGSRATRSHRKNSDTDILVIVPDDLVGNQYLGAVRILQKLSSHFDNYDIQPAKAGTNIHRIAQEEGRLLWSNKQAVAEGKLNFEEGDCPIFAIALHRLSKMPLMALVEYDDQMGSTVLIHAYVKLDDRWRLDASGETDVDWMLQRYPNNGNAEEIEISEKDLLELGYGKSQCPTLQQVLPHAKEVLQNIEEVQPGVAENFADGRNPQDKGDSKRHGINTKASVTSLRKTAKQGGRKGQLAHWLANMKSGRAKKK